MLLCAARMALRETRVGEFYHYNIIMLLYA